MVEFVVGIIFSLVVIPAVIIGMSTGGYIYGEKIEPWLKRKLGD